MTITLTSPALAPRAGGYGDMERDDNGRGYERDETDTGFRQLVHHLVADGDDRARTGGRRARRTLAEMAPGYQRQPVLLLTRPLPMRSANDACPLCGRWNGCPCFAPAPAGARVDRSVSMAACSQCGGTGQRMVTVCHVGADGTPYQSVEMQPCSTCSGTGQVG
ncbi:hypothetical protein [uncultured Streptomyces sp.]|uniref:hypothetical protein n=1 Tax=uncultured Streptomyces sp. TaxID=174707 RepID=UPI00261A2DC0|nr:hypothetical protein [uncultured Streptomyces sp.]